MGENAAVITNRPLTYVIYWRRRKDGVNGHSAMIIDSSKINKSDTYHLMQSLDNNDNYVSWLAGENTANPTIKTGVSSSFTDDMDGGWGGYTIETGAFEGQVLPTRWVALRGLDLQAMTAEWLAIRDKEGSHWKLVDKNCSTVVARVLKAGCRSVGAKGSRMLPHPLFWTPDGVTRWAKSLKGFVYLSST